MNSPAITANTREPNRSSAFIASAVSRAPITWPSTSNVINEEGRNIIWMFLYVAPLCFSLVLLAIFVSFLNNQFNHFYPREFPSIKNLIKTKCHFSFTRLQSPHIEQKSVNQQPKLGKTEQFFRVAMICYF